VRLLFATRNPGKARELKALATGFDVLSLADVTGIPDVEETEDTLEGNARLKALAVSRTSGLWALADDSGLFVDALEGAPGVRSARYADGSDADRVAKLLGQMERVPDGQRGAAFRCVLALASPAGEVTLAEGECRGEVLRSPRGSGGFGYDPVLLLPELGRTMAELTLEEKGRVSHRARAFERMRTTLTDLARRGSGESF
jgi:XTP/dITP diphosphohydrolase